MNETCKDCDGLIYWVEDVQRWYHESILDTIHCPAIDVEPARAGV